MIGRGIHPLLPRPVPDPRPAPILSADRDGQGHRIMVLRHQVRILERQLNVRAAYRPVDRAILATLSRLLARWRWRSFLVTPETLLCWHREVSRRKWRRWRSTRGLKGAQTHFRPREVGSERERGCARSSVRDAQVPRLEALNETSFGVGLRQVPLRCESSRLSRRYLNLRLPARTRGRCLRERSVDGPRRRRSVRSARSAS